MHQGLVKRLSRPLWFVLAALFLFEAWLWDVVGGLLTRLAAAIAFESLKQALVRAINALPAPLVLLLFVIPIAVIEPFKIVGLWLIAHHHFVYGAGAFVAAKVFGVGVAAFLFDATRGKLLSMAWFARFYAWVMKSASSRMTFWNPINGAFAKLSRRSCAGCALSLPLPRQTADWAAGSRYCGRGRGVCGALRKRPRILRQFRWCASE